MSNLHLSGSRDRDPVPSTLPNMPKQAGIDQMGNHRGHNGLLAEAAPRFNRGGAPVARKRGKPGCFTPPEGFGPGCDASPNPYNRGPHVPMTTPSRHPTPISESRSESLRGMAIPALLAAPILVFALLAPTPAEAYIGPGAGFAFIGSFFVLLWALVLAVFTILFWPFRLGWRALRRKSLPKDAPKRVVIIGLDGMDPKLTERLMSEGRLPEFSRLAAEGSFRRLGTTHPPLSPVAWSSFMTGAHPPRHGIFDFLHRDARTYLPFLSSSEVEPVKRSITIGKFEMPLGRPKIRMLRRAKPFWQILGEHGVFSNVLRVPVTFPAEPFYGACLSGMSVPDLRGTQGSFTYFTDGGNEGEYTGGLRVPLTWEGNTARAVHPGPRTPAPEGPSAPRAAARNHPQRERRSPRASRQREVLAPAGRILRVDPAHLQRRTGDEGERHRALPARRPGRSARALHDTHQRRSREPRRTDLAPQGLRPLSRQDERAVLYSRPRRGHLGA